MHNTVQQQPGDEKRQLTFGEQLVGIEFNPAKDPKVQRVKELCAELADLLDQEASSREMSKVGHWVYTHSINLILDAQMNVVKYLTLKY